MMEQSDTCHGHGDVVFIACFNHMVVANGASGLCDVRYTAFVRALNVVTEGEEGVATQGHFLVLGYPGLLFICGERCRFGGEELLPSAVLQQIFVFVTNVLVNGVVTIGTANVFLEGQIHDLWALAKPPCVGFLPRQTCAMDAALLSGTDADGLSVLYIAYAVALGVLEDDEGDDEISLGFIAEMLVFGGDMHEE